jgi:hypothetical protein
MRNHGEPMAINREIAAEPSSQIRTFKIYGERNTGSTYLERLLTHNFEVGCLPGGLPKPLHRAFPHSERARDWYFQGTWRWNLGWKHACPPSPDQLAAARTDPARVLFVTLTKNPYAWLHSLYRRPYHARRAYTSFRQFLSDPWEPVGRENVKAPFANPIELWNVKNRAYIELGHYATAVQCRYEDLLADPYDFLKAISNEHALRRRRESFQNIDDAVKNRDRGKTFATYKDYYLNERWREELETDCISLINECLDPRVMAHFGYQRIETAKRHAS